MKYQIIYKLSITNRLHQIHWGVLWNPEFPAPALLSIPTQPCTKLYLTLSTKSTFKSYSFQSNSNKNCFLVTCSETTSCCFFFLCSHSPFFCRYCLCMQIQNGGACGAKYVMLLHLWHRKVTNSAKWRPHMACLDIHDIWPYKMHSSTCMRHYGTSTTHHTLRVPQHIPPNE